MQYSRIVICLLAFYAIFSCNQSVSDQKSNDPSDDNIAAEGFNTLDSDSTAITIADEVMKAIGGRKNWDETKFLKWNFFGARRHIWNKSTGDLIIEGIKDTFDIRMNLKTNTGTVNYKGVNLTAKDSLQKYLDKGKSMWINDSYWVFMPHKLKDSGVTLQYQGRDTTQKGRIADILSLTFQNIGDTPENMYKVYVDDSTRLISQWDFYNSADDTIPRFTTPWNDYSLYDRILLSNSRGGDYLITEISASDTLSKYF